MSKFISKKGFFFSMMAIALMILLVSFAGLLTQENDYTKQYVSERSTIFLQDEITTNILDILNVNLSDVSLGSNSVTYTFSNFSDLMDYSSELSSYESFLEGNYSTQTNTYVSLTGDLNTFLIHPHNASIIFDTNTIITADNLSAITVNVYTNYTSGDVTLTAGPASDASGDLITVTFHVTDDASYSFPRTLDDEDNAEFSISFTGGAEVLVNYSSEVMTINATNVDVTLEDVALTFERLAPTSLVVGNMTVDEITQEMIIFKE